MATVFQEKIDKKLQQQIVNLLDNPIAEKMDITFMPDAHPGKFFPIGLFAITNEENGIMPSLLGNDAGCGITAFKIKFKKKFSFEKLDKVINTYIPNGHDNHKIHYQ